ncbi:hypothetical protein FKW77_006119 [Venturia effusa]|uniref:Lysozyme n=1 Tax=Venturia effusa TaxID=50376 RepID=A0A517LLT7_9PEZI|nr:hypothetical protein FKW77_006119 [Venturia effusa]
MKLAIFLATLYSIITTTLAATACSINSGQNGVCISTASCKSGGGKSEAGHCPGSADIQCCTYGSCTASGVAGLCQSTSSCKQTSTPGLCPGPADIQCCHGSGGASCGTPTVNAATLTLIKEFEGFSPRPYKDPDGHPTIGVGHLCSSASCSEIPYSIPLSVSDGEKLLQSDLKVARTCITKDVHVKLNANQFGALVSWAFNVGCGGAGSSTLVKRLNAGENPNTVAGEELPKWNKGDGGVLPGLTRRRKAEVDLFKTGGSGPALPPSC